MVTAHGISYHARRRLHTLDRQVESHNQHDVYKTEGMSSKKDTPL